MSASLPAQLHPDPPSRAWWRCPWWWAVAAALLVRLAMIAYYRSWTIFPELPFAFGWETGAIARSIVEGHGFSSPFGIPSGPTAWISPLYPYLCALVFHEFGVYTVPARFVMVLIGSVFSALTCVPIYHVGRRTVGPRVALVACWTWALLPHFGKWASRIVWETALSGLLLIWLIQLAFELEEEPTRRRWIKFGLWMGIAALANPALCTFGPVCAIWLWLRLRATPRFWRNALLGGAVCLAVVAPWMVRNRVVFGHWVFLRGNFGFEFRLGNYHLSNGLGWRGYHPTQNQPEMEKFIRIGEYAYVADAQRKGMEFVRQYPGEFVRLTAKRFLLFWNGEPMMYSPSPEPWNPATFFAMSLATFFGWMWAASHKVRGMLLLSYPWVYAVPYFITYPHPRYRHAIEPEMLLLAVYGLAIALELVRRAIRARGHAASAETRPIRAEA